MPHAFAHRVPTSASEMTTGSMPEEVRWLLNKACPVLPLTPTNDAFSCPQEQRDAEVKAAAAHKKAADAAAASARSEKE